MRQEYLQNPRLHVSGYSIVPVRAYGERTETIGAGAKPLASPLLSKPEGVMENGPVQVARRGSDRYGLENRWRISVAPAPELSNDLIAEKDRIGKSESVSAPVSPPDPLAKLDAELAAFERMRGDLLAMHRGRFVAIHHGRLIDVDDDEFLLAGRIEDKARREGAIAICKVCEHKGETASDYPYCDFDSPIPEEDP